MDELRVTYFNVDHGDSCVIQFTCEENKYYFVVDSKNVKRGNSYINPAYEYLKSQDVHVISALIITHFHKDHISGVEKFFDDFSIEKICIPPVFTRESKIITKIVQKYKAKIKEIAKRTHDNGILMQARSLTLLINYIEKNVDKVEEYCGREMVLRIPGNGEEIGKVYLPLPKMKGIIGSKITSDNFEVDNFPEMNDMSIAFSINAFGKNLLFTGDSTKSQWLEHRRLMRGYDKNNLKTHILKVPHHGSENNNDRDLYGYLMDPGNTEKHIIISANGRSHPHETMFDLARVFNLTTHCTNFSTRCQRNIQCFEGHPKIPAEAMSFICTYKSQDISYPCHGNITLCIYPNKPLQIYSESIHKCLYDYQRN